MSKICVFFAEGFEECEGLLVVDILRRGGVEVTTVSISDSLQVVSSHGIAIQADILASDFQPDEFDGLFLPGGLPGTLNLDKSDFVHSTVSRFYQEGKWVCAICAAPSILGGMGLLKGRQATSFPAFQEKLEGATVLQSEFVQDGTILTGKGLGAAIPFALQLLALLEGEAVSQKIRTAICYAH